MAGNPKNPFEATFAAVGLLGPHIEFFTQLVAAQEHLGDDHTLDRDEVGEVYGLAKASLEFVVAVHRIASESAS